MIAAKQFNKDGTLFSPVDERVSLYGDVITVNAVPWPYHQVEPRKYKFRILDASISRSYSLYLVRSLCPVFQKNILTFARLTRQNLVSIFHLLLWVQMPGILITLL
jgi:hypothetical protein